MRYHAHVLPESLQTPEEIQTFQDGIDADMARIDKTIRRLAAMIDASLHKIENGDRNTEIVEDIRVMKNSLQLLSNKKLEIVKKSHDFLESLLSGVKSEILFLENNYDKTMKRQNENVEEDRPKKRRRRFQKGESNAVDENSLEEPTYCSCNRIAFGEMIACDNKACPIEWYHYSCVNIIAQPKGLWFCPVCTIDNKKKN